MKQKMGKREGDNGKGGIDDRGVRGCGLDVG